VKHPTTAIPSSSSLSLRPSTSTSSRSNSRTSSLFVASPLTREEETAAAAKQSVEQQPSTSSEDASSTTPPPVLGDDGIYHVTNQEEYKALLSANPDQIIVLKVYAPWCRACKGLEPKFAAIVHDDKYATLPVIFADLSIQHNKAFVQQIGVLALPTIQLYIGQAVQDNFPCGPSKVPILKRKLTQLIDDNVDTATNKLKEEAVRQAEAAAEYAVHSESSEVLAESKPTPVTQALTGNDGATPIDAVRTLHVPQADRILWKSEIPYFAELSLADYDVLLDKAKILQFESGSILMREGRPGRTFYILQSGEVEICQRSMMGDPMTTPASYLGTVINRFQTGDFFGERALITGEPRAASIRATENITCWAFDKDDFPPSSVLSGKTRIQDDSKIELVNDKYGVAIADLYQQNVAQQIRESSTMNQVRGSFNRPGVIHGVDTEEEAAAAAAEDAETLKAAGAGAGSGAGAAAGGSTTRLGVEDDAIFSLLNRFKMVQLVTRCFRYICRTRAQWGDEGIRTRRSMLVSRLTPSQRGEYRDAFRLIDKSGDGMISLLELKRVMNSIGDFKTDDELKAMIAKARDSVNDDESVLNLQDFMGIMAETEFYHLFRDIFASMDPNDTGFVKKADLERVLCGVRDLISDDRKSIIDVEDDDMLIDYEQFTRMLLGSALI
jgi:calmodulin